MATGQELENQTINLTVWEEWQKERKLDLEVLSKNTDHLFLVVASILIFFMQVFVTVEQLETSQYISMPKAV